MPRSIPAVALVSALLLACASGNQGDTAGDVTPSAAEAKAPEATAAKEGAKKAGSADAATITAGEIEEANLPNAYELVNRLRRPWLRRDALTGGDVVVYMDEQNVGGADKLRDIPSVDVAELQYLRNDEAVRRWGAAIKGSVIVVVRRR